MHSRVAHVLLLLACCCLSSPSSAQATSVKEAGFTDLVHQAEVIAVGTVSDIREQWDDTRKAPLTLVTFSNLTVLKGNPGESFTLEFLGGTMPNGLVMVVPGVPQFVIGEKAVLFSSGNHRDFCPLVGVWQGLLRVTLDPQRGIETVSDNFHVPIAKIQDGKFVKLTAQDSAQDTLSLPALLQTISQELANSQSPGPSGTPR